MPILRNPTSQQTIADHRAKLRTTTELLMRNVEFPLAQSTVGTVDSSKFEVGLAPWDAPVDWPRIDPRIEACYVRTRDLVALVDPRSFQLNVAPYDYVLGGTIPLERFDEGVIRELQEFDNFPSDNFLHLLEELTPREWRPVSLALSVSKRPPVADMRALADAHRLWRGAPFWPSQGLYSHFVIPSIQLGPNPFPTSTIYSYQGSTLRSFAERIEEHDSVLSLSRLKKHKNQPNPKVVRYYQPSPHYISLSGIPDMATIAAIKASRARPLSTPSVTQRDYTFAYLPRNAPHPLLSSGFYCRTSLDGMAKVSPGALLLAETLRNISTRSVQGTTFRLLLKKRYRDNASLEVLHSNGGNGRACASEVGAVGGYPGAEAFYPGVTVGGFKDSAAQAARGVKGAAARTLAGRATKVALVRENPAKYSLIGRKAVAVANDVKHRKRMQKMLDGTWESQSVHPREAHVVVTKRYQHSKYFKVVKRDKKGWYSLDEFKGLEGRQLKAFVKVAVPQIFAAEPNWSATLRVVDATTGLAVKEWAFDRDHTRYAPSKPGIQNPFGPELSDTTRNHFSDLAKDIAGFLQLTTAKALPGARVAELPASAESIEMVDEADSDDDDDEYALDAPDDRVPSTYRIGASSLSDPFNTATLVGTGSPPVPVRPPLLPAVDPHMLDLTLDDADHEYLDLTLGDANSEPDFIDLTVDAVEPATEGYRRNFNDGSLRTWLKSAGRA